MVRLPFVLVYQIAARSAAAAAFWGNQSERPDHLGEARQIPGTTRVLFSGFGHHDVWVGCIGIVDPRVGSDFPDGIWKVTRELPWPEVGDGSVPTAPLTTDYHTSGRYAGYKTPYPLSEELFLVSARTGATGVRSMRSAHDPTIGKFKLYLMDIHGNRELIYQGDNNVLYAQPVRSRKTPPLLPDLADMPGSEKDNPAIRPGVFFSNARVTSDRPRMIDIAPTVLDLFGVSVPAHVEGEPLALELPPEPAEGAEGEKDETA